MKNEACNKSYKGSVVKKEGIRRNGFEGIRSVCGKKGMNILHLS